MLISVSRACQDVIRPLELNWQNVGELCNYNDNLYSGPYYCHAKARQGGEQAQGTAERRSVYTYIKQEAGAETAEPKEQSHLLYNTDIRGVPSAATPALGDNVMVNRL